MHQCSNDKTNRYVLLSPIDETEHDVSVTDTIVLVFDSNSSAKELFSYCRSTLINHTFKILREKESTDDEIEFSLDVIFTRDFSFQEKLLVRKMGPKSTHAESKGLIMKVDVDHNLLSVVRTDANRLRQVLLNLIGDTIKFTPLASVFSILLKSEIVEVSSKQNALDMEEINLDDSILSE